MPIIIYKPWLGNQVHFKSIEKFIRLTALSLSTARSSRRSMRALAKAHIKETWKRGHGWNEEGYLFATIHGGIPRHTTAGHTWRATLKKTGVEHRRLYQTRHTHATKLLQNNIHPKLAQDRLGHSTVKTTLDVYSKVMPEGRDAVADTLERLHA